MYELSCGLSKFTATVLDNILVFKGISEDLNANLDLAIRVSVSCRVFFSVSICVLVFYKNWYIFPSIHAILRYSRLYVMFIFCLCRVVFFVVFYLFFRVVSNSYFCHVVSYVVSKIARSTPPIKVTTFFDTGATQTIANLIVLSNSFWKKQKTYFKTVDENVFLQILSAILFSFKFSQVVKLLKEYYDHHSHKRLSN